MARRRRRPPRPGGPKRRKKRPNRPQQPTGPVIPDTEAAKLEETTRKQIQRIIELRSTGSPLTEAERLLDRILEQHPDLLPAFADADTHVPQGDEASPFLHVAMHRIVEERVVSREMPRLDTGKPWHEAVHQAMETVADELFVDDAATEEEEEAV